jgi:hypothetical protein
MTEVRRVMVEAKELSQAADGHAISALRLAQF